MISFTQSLTTRNYLNSVVQGNITLPPGPVIMSPDRLISSFKREVIHKKPEVNFQITFQWDLLTDTVCVGFQNRVLERHKECFPSRPESILRWLRK